MIGNKFTRAFIVVMIAFSSYAIAQSSYSDEITNCYAQLFNAYGETVECNQKQAQISSIQNSLSACQSQLQNCDTCCFKFKTIQLPSFELPPAQPNSPGDVVLSGNNTIILSNGAPLTEVCNGNNAQYQLSNGSFVSTFIDVNGNQQTLDIFYASEEGINVRTIQATESNLANILSGKLIRMYIACNNNLNSCIEFYINNSSKEQITIPNIGLSNCMKVPESEI